MWLFCSINIHGLENIEQQSGNVIIASNHLSEIDPLLIVGSLPFLSKKLPLIFVVKEKKYYQKDWSGWKGIVYGGKFFKMMGAYEAYSGLRDYEQALKTHLTVLQEGKTVCIFPVGKRHQHHEASQARGGVSFLAQQSGVPIVPVRIEGVDGLSVMDYLMRKSKLTITFGNPLRYADIATGTRHVPVRNKHEQAATRLMHKIAVLRSE